MKNPGDIIFPKPETTFVYAPMANPGMFSSLNSSSPGHKMIVFEWLKSRDDLDKPFSSDTSLNKFEATPSAPPTLEDLEFLVNNFSPPDKETFQIAKDIPDLISFSDEEEPKDTTVHKVTDRSSWNSSWPPAPDKRDVMKSEYHKDWSASSTY